MPVNLADLASMMVLATRFESDATTDRYNIRDLLEPGDYSAQCRQVSYFDAEVHYGLHRFLVQVRRELGDVGVFVGQYRADIA